MSHDVSHFAAFFIVVGAKTSIAESVDFVNIYRGSSSPKRQVLGFVLVCNQIFSFRKNHFSERKG